MKGQLEQGICYMDGIRLPGSFVEDLATKILQQGRRRYVTFMRAIIAETHRNFFKFPNIINWTMVPVPVSEEYMFLCNC
jgi:hypothetical protein